MQLIEKVEPEARVEPRTNMFVMATVSGSTAAGPVKVRNLSSRGALIEGAALPRAKEKVSLRRGRLVVAGEVVWSRSGQAGLRFRSGLNVDEWLPKRSNLVAQQRVDDLLQQIRSETDPCSPATAIEEQTSEPVSGSELSQTAAALEMLADELAGDDAVIRRHSSGLQTLDIAAQLFRRLAAARW